MRDLEYEMNPFDMKKPNPPQLCVPCSHTTISQETRCPNKPQNQLKRTRAEYILKKRPVEDIHCRGFQRMGDQYPLFWYI